jgi:hypothetical protein
VSAQIVPKPRSRRVGETPLEWLQAIANDVQSITLGLKGVTHRVTATFGEWYGFHLRVTGKANSPAAAAAICAENVRRLVDSGDVTFKRPY